MLSKYGLDARYHLIFVDIVIIILNNFYLYLHPFIMLFSLTLLQNGILRSFFGFAIDILN